MNLALLFGVTILGTLSYFEPCTIATHTLFSVRVYQQSRSQRLKTLLILWITRSLLSSTLLIFLVLITNAPHWPFYMPSVILLMMATLYIVSRFVYVPVPHLEFYKLLPKMRNLPHSVQLGLTLPACTIPLFVIVIGIVLTVNTFAFALLSGVLFATMFSAPVAILGFFGVRKRLQDLLNIAAKATPFITAVLLGGAAIYLLLPYLNLNADSMKIALQEASFFGILLAFFAGLLFSFNPVAFTSLAVILAYVTKAKERRQAIFFGIAFIVGMILTHVALGIAAALGGEWVKHFMGRQWGLLLGPVLIFLGLIWPGWIKIRLPWLSVRGYQVTSIWGAFLLGIPFTVAVCPFCTPALLVVLTASATIGSVYFGLILTLSFALGRSLPIILGVWGVSWLSALRARLGYQKLFEIVGGISLIIAGLYLLNAYFFLIQF